MVKQWNVEYTDEFGQWWGTLTEGEQEAIGMSVGLLINNGPQLGRPHAETVNGSKFANMKELRTQYRGRPFRTFFAFDPLRSAILLVGGDKTGEKQFYESMIPRADALYEQHLVELEKEGEQE